MFDHHTADIIFNLLKKFLDTLYLDWCSKLLNVSSDDEHTP